MPRDEPVGSLGRLALKPTQFHDQLGMVGFPVLHDAPPCFDDWGGDLLPGKAGAAQETVTEFGFWIVPREEGL